jgi:diguanylate cyclase (GGDEF)-like protein
MAERVSRYPALPSVLIGTGLFAGLSLTGLYNFLLFHTLAEMFSIVIGLTIFILAWNSRSRLDNDYLVFLGIACLFVSGLDLIHTLAYKGMGVFPGYGSNLATQLWIAARGLQSLSLLVSIVFLRRKLPAPLALGVLAILTVLVLAAIFSGVFPACFIEGTGLTPFKKISEYVISLVFLAAAAALLRNRKAFDADVLRWLVLSILLTVVAELAFTLYSDVYGVLNFAGHILKILAFYLVYKAILDVGIEKPHRLLFRNLQQSEESLREALEQARLLARTDALTGLYNRRHFSELTAREFQRAQRYGRPLCAVMLDVDHFKRVNDTHGHAAGDGVLKDLAARCRQVLRKTDLLGRYGGEEYAIVLPEADLAAACQTAERLRRECSQRAFEVGDSRIAVTVSLGVAALDEECASQDTLLDRADHALYAAKHAGRNQVCVWRKRQSIATTNGG